VKAILSREHKLGTNVRLHQRNGNSLRCKKYKERKYNETLCTSMSSLGVLSTMPSLAPTVENYVHNSIMYYRKYKNTYQQSHGWNPYSKADSFSAT